MPMKKTAIIVAAILAGVALAAVAARGASSAANTPAGGLAQALLSPGKVNRHHDQAACLDCHVAFRGTENQGCLTGNCHSRSDLAASGEHPARASLHKQTFDQKCTSCHTEHRADGRLTVAFHSAGVAASAQENCAGCHAPEGRKAHPEIADARCAACHTSTKAWDRIQVDHAKLEKPDACADCHGAQGRKAHPDIRSQDCAACHTSRTDWKQVQFDHKLVQAERCTDCHRVPGGWLHQAAADVACTVCHNTERWNQISLRHPRIPEFREHMRIPCQECHPRTLKRAVPCSECHGRGGFFEGE